MALDPTMSNKVIRVKDIADVLTLGQADAALAASIFHYGEITIDALKRQLADMNIPVRL